MSQNLIWDPNLRTYRQATAEEAQIQSQLEAQRFDRDMISKGMVKDAKTGQWRPQTTEERTGITRPGFQSMLDDKGELQSRFRLDPTQSEAFRTLRSRAFSQGPSSWAQLINQRQALEEQNAISQQARNAQQALSTGLSGLSRFGGLSGGARERLVAQSGRDAMLGRSRVRRDGMSDRLSTLAQDETQKQNLMGQIGQTELSALDTNQQRMLQDVVNKQNFDMQKYSEDMKAWGAKQTADAQRQAAAAQRSGNKK